MLNRQIVVITGKLCSGKTGLADLLVQEFDFHKINFGDVIEPGPAPGSSAKSAQEPSNDCSQDIPYEPMKMVEHTNVVMAGLTKSNSIVVDCLTSIHQVTAYRKEYGSNLTHVHLYASETTLKERFSLVKCSLGVDMYDKADCLADPGEIESLKEDADVRIYTTRCDAKDTLIRVAACLQLYAPPDIRCVDVLVGGQYGSEGKGNIVSYLAREYDVMVRVGGPNAGHTVASAKGTYTYHHLPSGCRDVKALLLLGPGMTIKLSGLLKEIGDCRITTDRLVIDYQASIIEDEDVDSEEQLVSTIASTGSGSGAAAARRIMGRNDPRTRLARDIEELRPYLGSTVDKLEEAYRKRQSILLEGTQGSGLSIFHGDYPYVTSRDTNVAGCLAEAGISPTRVRKVMMVVRPMPIRVGDPDGVQSRTSGPLKHPTTFTNIAFDSGLDADALNKAERTSTTNRSRKVGWFEWDQFRKACSLNAPTDIILTFADYLDAKNKDARRFEQLQKNTIKFVEELERVAKAPVSLINTRFQKDPGANSDLRSIIDRRTWNARTTSSRTKWTSKS